MGRKVKDVDDYYVAGRNAPVALVVCFVKIYIKRGESYGMPKPFSPIFEYKFYIVLGCLRRVMRNKIELTPFIEDKIRMGNTKEESQRTVTNKDGKCAVGLIINPIAGLGGRAGLKGSDGLGLAEKARALGGSAEASQRTIQLLSDLIDWKGNLIFYTYAGEMGEVPLKALGFETMVVGCAEFDESTARDTINAARLITAAGVELLLFAGGDGTARDICGVIGCSIPVIGIPAGVKMHSAVYAVNPRNAALAAREFLSGDSMLREAEVMDVDEELFREGHVSAKLYGYMMVPQAGDRLQKPKSGGRTEAGDLAGIAAYITDNMTKDTIYLIGPGSTTRAVMDELKLPNTLLGVDAIQNKQLLAADMTERQIWEMISDPAKPVKIIITVIGGQGSLLGRGNQQFSPRVISRVGRENIIVIATTNKLLALNSRSLAVDTGDTALDDALCGYIEVITAYANSTFFNVRN